MMGLLKDQKQNSEVVPDGAATLFWKALEVEGMCGFAMYVDASVAMNFK